MYAIPQCLECKHLIEITNTPAGEECTRMRCKAFDRIPKEIIFNEFKHTKPFPGDHGIRFEPRGDAA